MSTRLVEVNRSIRSAAARFGRNPEDIRLVAVSKKQPTASIQEAMRVGQVEFAENYVQEAVEKIRALKEFPLTWHYIGRIQKNKIPSIAQYFSWVHSVSSVDCGRRLDQARSMMALPLNVCIQVNIDNDPDKAGVSLDKAGDLVDALQALSHLRFRGFMCMTQNTDDLNLKKQAYCRLASLMQHEQSRGIQCDTLSMGLSSDFEEAIEAGATLVRIGTAIFGERR